MPKRLRECEPFNTNIKNIVHKPLIGITFHFNNNLFNITYLKTISSTYKRRMTMSRAMLLTMHLSPSKHHLIFLLYMPKKKNKGM
jgi:hypothetical protein